MLKRIIIIFLSFIIVITSFTYGYATKQQENIAGKIVTDYMTLYKTDNCKLIINEKIIEDFNEYVTIYYTDDGVADLQIPIITIIKELGGKIIWLDSHKCFILFNGHIFWCNSEKNFISFPIFAWADTSSLLNLARDPFAGCRIGQYYALDYEFVCVNKQIVILKRLLGIRIRESFDLNEIYVEKR